jgi:chemotaxis protein histidine kinase CheA
MKDEELARTIAGLRADYAEQLPRTVAQMEDLWQRYAGAESANLQLAELVRMAHSIVGSGTTFGLPRATETARDLEQFLDRLGDSGRLPGPAEQEAVMSLFAALRQAADQP